MSATLEKDTLVTIMQYPGRGPAAYLPTPDHLPKEHKGKKKQGFGCRQCDKRSEGYKYVAELTPVAAMMFTGQVVAEGKPYKEEITTFYHFCSQKCFDAWWKKRVGDKDIPRYHWITVYNHGAGYVERCLARGEEPWPMI